MYKGKGKNMGHKKIDTSRFRFAVLTLSDKGSQGLREDTSGPYLIECLKGEGYNLADYEIIPDKYDGIVDKLKALTADGIDLIVTTGGTGPAPTDVTPEATLIVIERATPGISEAMRAASLLKTHHAMLSRGVSGICGTSLIINLPGSLKAAKENIEVVLPALPHALDKINGGMSDCGVSLKV